jgi:hypothetical protein
MVKYGIMYVVTPCVLHVGDGGMLIAQTAASL